MQKTSDKRIRKSAVACAIAASLNGMLLSPHANADVYVWGSTTPDLTGITTATLPVNYNDICTNSPNAADITFTMLAADGAALENSSKPNGKAGNNFQTQTCGTITYDTDTDTGAMTIAPFDFFGGSEPALATGVLLNRIPAANTVSGTDTDFLLANMLFDWNGVAGIPVSLALDSSPLLDEMDGTPSGTYFTLASDGTVTHITTITGTGTTPASDGTYTNAIHGYTGLGALPVASLDFNTQNVAGCTTGSCSAINPSADINLPLQVDGTTNVAKPPFTGPGSTGTSPGIGGNPMQDGPFQGSNANFDFDNLRLISFTDTTDPIVTLNGSANIFIVQGNPYVEQGATCTDAAPLDAFMYPVGAPSEAPPLDINTIGTYTLTYTCTDDSGNVGTAQRFVEVQAPNAIITLNQDGNGDISPVTQECTIAYTDAGASCNDPEDGVIALGANFSLDQSDVDNNIGTPGSYAAVWSCTDSAMNNSMLTRTVDVVDTTMPTVSLLGNDPDDVVSSTAQNVAVYTDPQATPADTCDTALVTPFNATAGAVNMTVPDTGPDTLSYSLNYAATDADGNIGSATRTVNVTRSQPVISLVGSPISVVVNVGDPYIEEGFTIIDAQDGDVSTPVTATGACGTGMNCTVTSNVNINAQGVYSVDYDVTDSDGNLATTVSRKVIVQAYAINSNFTMLDGSGSVFGGTNDVLFAWDQTANYDMADFLGGTATDDNMVIATLTPTPFFAFVWQAHNARVFENTSGADQTFTFDTGCTAAEIEAHGCPSGSAAASGDDISMTIPDGHFGVHVLFDWNTTTDIDVVNVWQPGGVWNNPDGQVDLADVDGPATAFNDLHPTDGVVDATGSILAAANPNGCGPDPATTWALVSIDHDGDGINGSPMVDGPFSGSNANFNATPTSYLATCLTEVLYSAPDTSLSDDTIGSFSIAGILSVLFTALGIRSFRRKK